MLAAFVSKVITLIFAPLFEDDRKEYRFRCLACYEVSGEKLDPPIAEEDRTRMLACTKCGHRNPITIPIAPEESPDDDAPK